MLFPGATELLILLAVLAVVAVVRRTRRAARGRRTSAPQLRAAQPTAGWYPDGEGGVRWWNGSSWTDKTLPPRTDSGGPATSPDAPLAPPSEPLPPEEQPQVTPGATAGPSSRSSSPASPNNLLASWALGLGLFSYFLSLPGVAVAALVCGHLHISRTDPGPGKGRGMAIAGLASAYITWFIYLYWWL